MLIGDGWLIKRTKTIQIVEKTKQNYFKYLIEIRIIVVIGSPSLIVSWAERQEVKFESRKKRLF